MRFEEILPEIRKGKKARREQCPIADLAPGDKYLDLTVEDVLADDWEIVSKFNLKDKVFHVGHGVGQVHDIAKTDYPIGVLFENGFASSFTEKGCYHDGHAIPQLLTLEEAKAKGYAVPETNKEATDGRD
jgi:hypothetical protein